MKRVFFAQRLWENFIFHRLISKTKTIATTIKNNTEHEMFCCRRDLGFGECAHLKNPWNENKPVKVGRDGQVSWLLPL